jgi:4'-phosphopantetheinyl transferase
MDNVWYPAPASDISPDEAVHIWRIELNSADAVRVQLAQLLNEEETRRANRFHFEKDRHHFTVARGRLRQILSRYTGTEPHLIPFVYNDYGKPFLRDSEKGPYFNLSHSKDMGLIAISYHHQVGVDIEYMQLRDATFKIANRFFSEHEISELRGLPAEDQLQGFFNCWTRKEAYIKGKGKGLAIPLGSFSITLTPGAPVRLLNDDNDADAVKQWSFSAINAVGTYAAAVAVKSPTHSLKCWDYRI